jgi:signal transduction histidine kinase
MSDWDRSYLQTPEEWARFVSAFAHELRTPVASFGMLADLLAESSHGGLGEQERRYCDNMREVAREIQSLVGDVSELARLLAGRVTLRPDDIALEALADQVEGTLRPQAWERGVALTKSVDPALPKQFRSDLELLRRLLVLLLGTAVSQARSEVFFRFDLERTNLRVVISSDGAPLPVAPPGALFVPFSEQVRAARPRGGRSLALPLAGELARSLGATLSAENRGERPSFDLSVPAAAGG